MTGPHETGPELGRRLRRRWLVVDLTANVVGVLVVLSFLHTFHLARDPSHSSADAAGGAALVAAYLIVAMPVAWVWRRRRTRAMWDWVESGRPPGPGERDLVLREPLREVLIPAALWAAALIVFSGLEALSGEHSLDLALALILGGVTTCALIYLLTERVLRPVMARALAAGPPAEPVGPRISTRLITSWALASGVPLLGLALLAIGVLGGHLTDTSALAVAILVVVAGGLLAGSIAMTLSSHSIADPVAGVRKALARVHAGDLEAEVTVDDGSEIGLLQAGFNEMTAGLRERERLRDLFGRHVGEDVARRALTTGVSLGGEVRETAALFVDLVGSTALASRRPPQDVVSLLNRFFAVVVDVTEACGGWVNRFEGDGALCVFGAPTEDPDAAGEALAAARLMRERVRDELSELDIGIGVSAGPAVAGNVGAERRLEYTLIGDPINEAARLCELAKKTDARVLVSGAALERASAAEAAHWRLADEEVILRGRAGPTRIAVPLHGDLVASHAVVR